MVKKRQDALVKCRNKHFLFLFFNKVEPQFLCGCVFVLFFLSGFVCLCCRDVYLVK